MGRRVVLLNSLQGNWEQKLEIPCIISQGDVRIGTHFLLDTGAAGIGFVNKTFAQQHALKLKELARHIDLYAFDGKRISTGRITHTARVRLEQDGHTESIELFVTTLGRQHIILGLPWMKRHKVVIKWDRKSLRYTSGRCTHHVSSPRLNLDLAALPQPPVNLKRRKNYVEPPKTSLRTQTSWNSDSRNAIAEMNRQLSLTEPESDPQPQRQCLKNKAQIDSEPKEVGLEPEHELDICAIGAAPMIALARKDQHELFAVSMRDIEKALSPKTHTDPATKVPLEHQHMLHVFSRKEADKLPEHRPYDHHLKLEPGKQPPFGPLYSMSQNELKVLRKYLDEHLDKGFIRASSSPVASPVIFVRKPGGGLRFCVDYRALNAITIKNRYPIPLLNETLARLSKARYYSKLDIIAAFNKLRIAKGDEWLTAFRTRYGLFEYLVMPFGLANAPSTFQHFVNDVLRPYLDVFCTAYIDDILIFSDSLEEHKKHVNLVLEALSNAGLQLDVDKCEFHKTEVLYLGLIISTNGISMDPEKVSAIVDWETPQNTTDVRAFIGFSNFYRRFIAGFSDLVKPLVELTKKNAIFTFGEACKRAFDELKNAFTTAPILKHFDPEAPCIVEADSSDYTTAGVLSQYDSDGVLHPVAFYSKRLSPAECNYEIYDKELLAIIRCFEQWRPELEGAAFPVEVLSDHKNLQYFCTTKQLSHRQARWSEYLSRFNFVIKYRPGSQGQKPDSLTRRSQDKPAQEEARLHRNQTLLRPELLVSLIETSRSPAQIIDQEYDHDEFLQEIIGLLKSGTRHSKKISLSECELKNHRLYYRGRLAIPNHDELKLKLLRHVHDSPVGGHPGRTKTLDILQREYYWPEMYQSVRRFVKSCHVCSRAKAHRDAYQGLLKPLPIPDRRWSDISVDFVVDLPLSKRCQNIMVVVDRLSKMKHLIAMDSLDAPEVARAFLNHVFKLHGLCESAVSDRGGQFISAFWNELTKQLGIKAQLSTAFHPETDGQTERVNAVMEQTLRAYVDYLQDDWVTFLPMVEFTMNNSTSESTRVSPFFANYGQHPRMGFEPPTGTDRPRHQRNQVLEANEFADKMSKVEQHVRDELRWAQAVYEETANRHRKPAPAYRVGDRVWLDTRHVATRRPSKKLDWKNVGPFVIKDVVSPHAYRLDLPETMKIHPVFHTSLLRPAAPEDLALPGQIQPPPQPVEVDGDQEYHVERVEDSRYNGCMKRFEYLVKWRGYTEMNWEPTDTVGETYAVEQFHLRYPDRLKPTGYSVGSDAMLVDD